MANCSNLNRRMPLGGANEFILVCDEKPGCTKRKNVYCCLATWAAEITVGKENLFCVHFQKPTLN